MHNEGARRRTNPDRLDNVFGLSEVRELAIAVGPVALAALIPWEGPVGERDLRGDAVRDLAVTTSFSLETPRL